MKVKQGGHNDLASVKFTGSAMYSFRFCTQKVWRWLIYATILIKTFVILKNFSQWSLRVCLSGDINGWIVEEMLGGLHGTKITSRFGLQDLRTIRRLGRSVDVSHQISRVFLLQKFTKRCEWYGFNVPGNGLSIRGLTKLFIWNK